MPGLIQLRASGVDYVVAPPDGAVAIGGRSPTVNTTVGTWPLRVSANGRYLVTDGGVPFFVHGDTAWSLTHNLTLTEAVTYLDDRQARGFNTLVIEVPDAFSQTGLYPDNTEGADTPDRYGNTPFTGTVGGSPDLSTPREAYWAHVDAVFDAARAREFAILFSACYLGSSDMEGIRTWLSTNGTTKCRTYGEFIGTRYGASGNVLFTIGGDVSPTAYATYLEQIRAGIAATAPNALFLTHWEGGAAPYAYPSSFPASTYDLYANYEYDSISTTVYDHYTQATTKPVLHYESHYEDDFGGQGAVDVRKYPYRAVLSGALCGHVYGNGRLWSFNNAGTPDLWTTLLNSAGAQYMAHVPTLFTSVAWWALEPSRDNTLMTAGHGDPDSDSGCQGAVTADHTLAMIFFPSQLTVTVSLAKVNGGSTVTGRWFNPATGAWTTIGSWASSGTRSFTPPTAQDYVLVLTS